MDDYYYLSRRKKRSKSRTSSRRRRGYGGFGSGLVAKANAYKGVGGNGSFSRLLREKKKLNSYRTFMALDTNSIQNIARYFPNATPEQLFGTNILGQPKQTRKRYTQADINYAIQTIAQQNNMDPQNPMSIISVLANPQVTEQVILDNLPEYPIGSQRGLLDQAYKAALQAAISSGQTGKDQIQMFVQNALNANANLQKVKQEYSGSRGLFSTKQEMKSEPQVNNNEMQNQ